MLKLIFLLLQIQRLVQLTSIFTFYFLICLQLNNNMSQLVKQQQKLNHHRYQIIAQLLDLQLNIQKTKYDHDKQLAISLKIGDETIKFSHLTKSLQNCPKQTIIIDIPYSITLKRYYPIKGIIKIFEQKDSKQQTILSITGLKTNQLFNNNIMKPEQRQYIQNDNLFEIEKDMGCAHFRINLQLNRIEKTYQNKQRLERQKAQRFQVKQKDIKDSQINNNIENRHKMLKIDSVQYMDVQKIKSMSFIKQSEFALQQSYIKQEIQILGEQLIQERRKNQILQDRALKNNQKIHQLKIKINNYINEIKKFVTHFQLISNDIIVQNSNIQINQNTQELKIKYQNKQFLQHFTTFLTFMEQVINQQSKLYNSYSISTNQTDSNLQNLQQSTNLQIKQPYKSLNKKIQQQLQNVQKQLLEKNKRMDELNQQLFFIQSKNRQLSIDLESCTKEIKSLKKKYEQILISKNSTIDHLTNLVTNQNKQVEISQKQKNRIENTLNNVHLQIEQYKEEIFNLSQIIDQYKSSYGELKHKKNMQLEVFIKECIRQIDLQRPELNDTDDYQVNQNVNLNKYIQIFKKIQLSQLKMQQLGILRQELINFLEKLEEFLKNSQYDTNIDTLQQTIEL